jgi:hypothetical protein
LTQVESKPCRRCGVVHPLSNFHNDKRRPDGKVDWCKDCRRAYRAEVYARDPQAAIDYQREWKRRNPHKVTEYGRRFRHGVEPDEFEALKAAQGGGCAICGRDDESLKVDHCHARSVVRGLLCDRCNRGIGYFADDPARLIAAAAYVQREGVMPHARR